jgi:tRNA threonylcarbamoyladenosine biosynthesis protein TsaB
MRILAVDTSSASGSIALLDDARLMVEWTLHSAQTHNRLLLKNVDWLLRELGWTLEQVDGFAVTIGPGSFTGLRIGVATIKTLAWAAGKPFVGIPSLEALAAPLGYASFPVCPLVDARKSEIYHAFYQPDGVGAVQLLAPFQVDVAERIVEKVQGPTIFCGDGWPLCRELFSRKLGAWAISASSPFDVIRAGQVGELACRRFQEQRGEDPMTCVPVYVRPSEAEIRRPQGDPSFHGDQH